MKFRRQAFTLVEMAITLLIASVFMSSLWAIYNASMKAFDKSSKKLEAVQGAYILYQKFMYDFRSAVFLPPQCPIKIESTLGGQNNRISFWAYDGKNLPLKAQNIVYEYNPDTFTVTRNEKAVTRGKFEDVQWLFEIPDPAASVQGNTILFRISGISGDVVRRKTTEPGKDRVSSDRVTFSAAVSLPYRAFAEHYPTWKMSPAAFVQGE